jgi:hypothetical protein
MPAKKKRHVVDCAQLRAHIYELLERRYGENGERVPRLGLPDDEEVVGRVRELVEFYKTPQPNAKGEMPTWNFFYVLAPSGFAKDSLELDKLFSEGIPQAKRPSTRLSRENRALQIIGNMFYEGFRRDFYTKKVVWEVPRVHKPMTSEEKEAFKERTRAMANAMWRRGSRDS